MESISTPRLVRPSTTTLQASPLSTVRPGQYMVGEFAPPLEFPSSTTAMSSATETEMSVDGSDGTSSPPIGVGNLAILLGPLIGIIAVAVLLGLIFRYRKPIRRSLHRRWPDTFNAPRGPSTSTISADALTTTEEAREERRRSNRRRRRRDSQRSVRTLPVYSENPGGEELVLVRKRSSSIASSFASGSDDEESMEERRERGSSPSAATPPQLASPSPRTQRLASSSSDATTASVSERGWGEAPTYLEAMSSIDLPVGDVEEGGQGRSRTTTSTFRGLLSHMRDPLGTREPVSGESTPTGTGTAMASLPTASLSSLMLQPSRTSHKYTPWTSSTSLAISPPVPNSAVRASLDQSALPSSGLSTEQMKFLGSAEVIGLVGRPFGEDEGRRRSRRSSSVAAPAPDEPLPPSWESLEQTRREDEARVRANLARPVRRSSAPDDENATPAVLEVEIEPPTPTTRE